MLTILKKHFGYDSFRPLQAEIVSHVLSKQDALVLMPTGGGKSLCFQLPALMLKGITVVISPLISLMKDQVDALQANGVPTAFINSTLDQSAIREIQNRAESGQLKILYLAPERLALPVFREWLRKTSVSLIAIDEAHCISEWGHDFRPDYRNLILLRRDFPGVPLIALTATATERVRRDIVNQLALRNHRSFVSSFNRPNLFYAVRPKRHAFENLVNLLERNERGSAIIYCFSRKGAESLAAKLQSVGLTALPYHAGLEPGVRQKNQNFFIQDEVRIIVATIAFGMGIDKPDVRLIVHYDLPKSVEGYYQETGRAGRDGLPSQCVLFYSYGDTMKQRFFIRDMEDADERDRAERQLQHMVDYCETRTCRRQFLVSYFGEVWPEKNCGSCDICLPQSESETRVLQPDVPFDRELFEQLRWLRKCMAQTRGVPPFVIFGDRSLQDMATWFPQTLTSFARVYGVGQSKLEQYGQVFLRVIQKHASAKGLAEKSRPHVPREYPAALILGTTHNETRKLAAKKFPLIEIAKRRGFTISTIISHLEKISGSGETVDLDYLRPDAAHLECIRRAFQRSGGWSLSPVRNLLGEGFGYEELRLARIFLRSVDDRTHPALPHQE